MLKIEHIVGNTGRNGALAAAAEQHREAGTYERVSLDAGERKRSRLRTSTDAGTDLGVLVDKPELEDGDVLYRDDDRMIVVEFDVREALAIDLPADIRLGTALELGHRVGNQHWDIAVEDGTVYVPVEADRHIVEDVLAAALPDETSLRYVTVDPQLFLDGDAVGADHEHQHEAGHGEHGHSHDHSERGHSHDHDDGGHDCD